MAQPRALVLGGTGLIGAATARRLLASGWQVDMTGRDSGNMPADVAAAGGRFIAADRRDPAALREAFGSGADLLVDCICFTGRDAELLVPLARDAQSTVLISTKAVYVDAHGNHSNSDVSPSFGAPVTEEQPTLPAGDMDYNNREGYGRNKVAAERVLLDSGAPVSVLRPSKVHGRGARPPREWFFVKRALDRRPAVILAHQGKGVDHTTAAVNIAALVEVVAQLPGRRILNSADPGAPSGLDIARTLAGHVGHDWDEVLLDGDPVDGVGAHPWDKPNPFVLDTSAAIALGYTPVGDYAATVADTVQWLVSQRAALDRNPEYASWFNYHDEDAHLAGGPAAPAASS